MGNQKAGEAPASKDEPRHAQRDAFRLFFASFLALFAELSLIRFLPAYLQSVAYFVNLVLIASFLGLGLGFLLASRARRLEIAFMPLVLLTTGAAWLLSGFSVKNIEGSDEPLWLSDASEAMFSIQVPMWIPVLTSFILVAVTFIPVGQVMGRLFGRFPRLKAYALDLGGSLTGVVGFGVLAALETPPELWFVIVACTATLALVRSLSARAISLVAGVAVVALVWWMGAGSIWSPYYKVDTRVTRQGNEVIYTNGILHQVILDLESKQSYNATTRKRFEYPYRMARSLDEVLIIGAGSGNDVAVALAMGAKHIDAVEIDPVFPRLGRARHPNKPYDSKRVTLQIQDARSWLSQTDKRYDLIVFGTLDSQALLSGLSSVRLDNYIYTKESFRDAYSLLKPGGRLAVLHMSISDYIADRIFLLLTHAAGRPPIFRFYKDHTLFNITFIQGEGLPFQPMSASYRKRLAAQHLPTDDWPYLYLREPSVPAHYLWALLGMLLTSVLGVGSVIGRRRFMLDGPMFFLGAGFLLLETQSVTRMSLLFGSTWVVNLLVFSSILGVLFLANLFVWNRTRLGRTLPVRAMFLVLAASLVVMTFIPVGWISGLPVLLKWIVGGCVVALPIGLAGLIFPSLFEQAKDPRAAFGSNLLGAIVGGTAEYLTMILGISSLTLMGAAFYLTAFLLYLRARKSLFRL